MISANNRLFCFSFLFPNKILVLLNNMSPGFNYINNSLLEQFQKWTCKIFQNADILISPTPLSLCPQLSAFGWPPSPPPPPPLLDADILYGWPLKDPLKHLWWNVLRKRLKVSFWRTREEQENKFIFDRTQSHILCKNRKHYNGSCKRGTYIFQSCLGLGC